MYRSINSLFRNRSKFEKLARNDKRMQLLNIAHCYTNTLNHITVEEYHGRGYTIRFPPGSAPVHVTSRFTQSRYVPTYKLNSIKTLSSQY